MKARVDDTPQELRCGIYTRKSTEEGLNQPFNSLEAQREAGEAYVLSQRQAGWVTVSERYDDGGFTGGNLERPALRRLLIDIQAGKVNCVVVYKVDRLSRSLLDFARLMEVLETHRASLVSVTQPLNTTISMGRLTLNILLSFAQFEREIIAERTRDKMSAARKKGQWMGGIPVLGFELSPGGGRLVVNQEEARLVRALFAFYVQCESLDEVLRTAQARGWMNKRYRRDISVAGQRTAFTKISLRRLFSNVVYTGKVRHQSETYDGQHEAVVEETIWLKAQALLKKEPGCRAPYTPQVLEPEQPIERVPRIARLMALAFKLESLLKQGIVTDHTSLAALGRISKSRLTQILNLRNLAPDIQEQLLFLTSAQADRCRLCEKAIRRLSSVLRWDEQRAVWTTLTSSLF
jgi:DNA invertase Pin-like site-specific DNA recombinase